MALERTLSIIKPDAVAKNVIGEIYARFEKAGLKVVAAKYKQLSRREAEGFYAVHRERPFFNALVEFMISGPVMIQALEGEKDTILGEINAYRDAHARIMTNWWSTLIAADPSHSSLALRATFDMDTLGNLNESSYVSWWHDNVLPWLKQHGEFFNHEMVEAQTQAILSEVGMQQAQVATKH